MTGPLGPSGPPDPGRWPDDETYPATQVLPQQLPTPAHGVAAQTPPRPPWQVGGLALLVIGAFGGLVMLLLVAFGVFDDDSDSVDTVDDAVPTPRPADLVSAIAETVFRCPDGAMGAPSVDDPNCVIAESTELVIAVEVQQTTYRCPAGTTGSPNAARPECARSASGAVAALTMTTLRCPQGSVGSPTVADPFCVAADQSVRVAVEAVVVHECENGAELDEAADPAECVRAVEERRTIPAVEDIRFECPADPVVEPTPEPEECRRELDEAAACAMPVQLVEDGPQWSCFGAFVTDVDDDASCPAGSAPDPERPAGGDGTDCYESEPACESGRYESSTERCVRSAVESATAIVEHVCPEDLDGSGTTVVGDECEYTEVVEVRRPATETTEYRCPEGSRGEGGSADAVCVATRDAQVRALAITTYSCPGGSTGSPTAEAPTCTSTTTDTVAAIIETEIAYECPDGAVGEPTADDPTCARTTGASTVPASVVTEFSCPAGSTGNPTFTDPFCSTTE